ncbi:tetratricopeptide repeat protein [Variovorax sp. OV329]|uniref:tetratricopeptide repeat protein n=1 Tax=Variovorax sp. OV329 TaxID=1882825 RepID=UPI0008EE5130|nr:tetratricopeptide repeat protein [Variovorax sp. OV329]SFN33158.1 TolB amino-terminal domain-containing protein [Variovorax sp. OV329]
MNNPSVNTRVALADSAGRTSGGEGVIAFDGFRFDPARQELVDKEGIRVALTPKSLALLQYMLAHAGRVLLKEELMRALWGTVVVTDDSLVQCVKDLRIALDDKGQQRIKTLPRRGYMFDVDVRSMQPQPVAVQQGPPAARPSWRQWLLACGALALAALLGAAAVWQRQGDTRISIDDEIRNRRSVAVLAFTDKQGSAQGSTLGDDLADIVGSQLVRAGVRVIGRAATVRQDPAEPQFERIGREQGVRYVLGGRVMRADGRITVDTYLTEIASGAVYRLHEAEFRSADEAPRPAYGREVLVALQARYYEIEVERARSSGRENNPVDRIALAWRDLDRGSSRADLESARRHFEAAVQADPYSVEAMLGLGMSHLSEFYAFYSRTPERTLEHAEQVLRRAMELAPDNARVMAAWAEVLLLRERPEEALWVWQRALEVSPESPVIHLRMAGALIRQGRYEDAQDHLQKVTDLRPFQTRRQQSLNQILADAAFAQGRDDEAYSILKHWAAEFPGSARPYLMLAALDALYWRDAAAADHMAKYREAHPLGSIDYVIRTYPSANPQFLAQRSRLLEGLRKAGLPDGGK